jgi:ribosomal protein S18 acetylase RimI-like enzyme
MQNGGTKMDAENKVTKKPSGSIGPSLLVRRHDAPLETVTVQVKDIYLEAFPPAQRMDFEALLATAENGRRRLFTAEAEGEVAGFAVTIPLPDTSFHCLEYLAVNREQRGLGAGSTLLRAVLGDLSTRENASGLILEVESDGVGSETEREVRRARIAFYRRNGAHMVDAVPRFLAPDLAEGGTLEMKLMWLPSGNGPSRLSGSELRTGIRGIYTQSYGLPPDDPLVESTLSSSRF